MSWKLDDLPPKYQQQAAQQLRDAALRNLPNLPGYQAAASAMTEADFTTEVLGIFRMHGWLAYHTHDSRKSEAGFPDVFAVRPRNPEFARLIAEGAPDTHPTSEQPFEKRLAWLTKEGARAGRVVCAELKTRNNYPTAKQRAWLAFLAAACPHIETHVWRPADLPAIHQTAA